MGLILLTNDDGYDAAGLQALYKELINKKFAVFVSAPRFQQSGSSHSLTLRRPIRVEKLKNDFYIIDGTPTDCVLLAFHDLVGNKEIEMVVSGINHGPNMGSDVFYSGTVAAALQAGTLGIKKALAISLSGEDYSNFEEAARYSINLINRIIDKNLNNIILNVNIPEKGIMGEKITRMGRRIYRDKVLRDIEENNVMYSVINGVLDYHVDTDTDFEAIENNFVSITPLKLDLTDYENMKKLKEIFNAQ
ncbi:MAG: 5'/3'-nucleotidase SurE [candidate division WOR-3 bacterium]|nr:5'/3'-nucleotidase SurE [candidate division WOR-3 bacterium]